jgi:hypothetical protein
MDSLIIEEGDDTPKVVLDKNKAIFEISGRSLPEDTVHFFKPVLEWLKIYKNDPNPSTDFVFKLDYTNTASSKLLLDILQSLQSIKNVKVIWYFHDDDEDMEEAGHEFAEQVDIPFEFKAMQ